MKELKDEWIDYLIMELDEEIDMIDFDSYIFSDEDEDDYF